LVKFKSSVILVVHKKKKGFLECGAISYYGFLHFIATRFFPEIFTSQYFNALHFENSSALNIEMGENSLTHFDDNELRASVWIPYFLYYAIHSFALFHT
jgi:hypothetical protein